MSDINFFGETNFRNVRRRFGIKTDDRRRHFYVIGKTGMGKTAMLENMAVQDIQNGHGIGFVDPHGEAAEELLNFIPEDRVKDVVYFNPADLSFPIAFNVMESVGEEYRHLVASGLMSAFKKIWPDVWSARMEYILGNTVLALLEYPDSTLLGINRMLSDVDYRQEVVNYVTDPVIKSFWTQEFARYTQRYEVEATAAIQNKVGQFISNPLIRNIVGQAHSSINMRDIMDEKKILILNLSKGRIGEDNSRLLGAMLITKIQLAAMSRIDIPEAERQDFFLYIDEFQNFASESFVGILSEARKYRLALILSHQYITQLEEEVRDAVFGNVGTIISFRVGAEDAEFLEKEFMPEFLQEHFVNLGKYNIYVKLMIDGLTGRPFSALTLPPIEQNEESQRGKIIAHMRESYATPAEEVIQQITDWAGLNEEGERMNASVQQTVPAEQPALYDAVCAICKKDTKVVFQPDGKRPVYCKKCRKKAQQEKEQQDTKKDETPVVQKEENEKKTEVEPAVREESKQEVPEPKKDDAVQENLSLKEAMDKDVTMFHGKGKKEKRDNGPKKEVNSQELKEVLKAALDKQKTKQDKGVIQPGETVYL